MTTAYTSDARPRLRAASFREPLLELGRLGLADDHLLGGGADEVHRQPSVEPEVDVADGLAGDEELAVGPEEIDYFHYLFRGTNNTYDVWFNWKLLNQDSDTIYKIVNSVTGEDILPQNNQNPF